MVKAHLSLSSRAVPPAWLIPHPANMCLALRVTSVPPEVPRTAGKDSQAGWLLKEVKAYVKGKAVGGVVSKLQFPSSVAYPLVPGSYQRLPLLPSLLLLTMPGSKQSYPQQQPSKPTRATISPSQNSPSYPNLTWDSQQMSTKHVVV